MRGAAPAEGYTREGRGHVGGASDGRVRGGRRAGCRVVGGCARLSPAPRRAARAPPPARARRPPPPAAMSNEIVGSRVMWEPDSKKNTQMDRFRAAVGASCGLVLGECSRRPGGPPAQGPASWGPRRPLSRALLSEPPLVIRRAPDVRVPPPGGWRRRWTGVPLQGVRRLAQWGWPPCLRGASPPHVRGAGLLPAASPGVWGVLSVGGSPLWPGDPSVHGGVVPCSRGSCLWVEVRPGVLRCSLRLPFRLAALPSVCGVACPPSVPCAAPWYPHPTPV